LQWDVVSTFNSGPSKTPLGQATIPAYDVLCSSCVSRIGFGYNHPDNLVVVNYTGTSDIVRQLQSGARIVITTTDDNIPYSFVVGESTPTTTHFTLKSIGLRETVFDGSTGYADLLLIGAQFEVKDLQPGGRYFFRVNAVNSEGICDSSLPFSQTCGAFAFTSPSSLIIDEPPAKPERVAAVVISDDSVMISWSEPHSVSPIKLYRVDAFMASPVASDYYSFYGDNEVQIVSTGSSSVTSGTFTVAYGNFSQQLPGVFSAFVRSYSFNTSEDLTSLLEPGDQFMVAGRIYTVDSYHFITSSKIFVKEAILVPNSGSNLIGAVAFSRSKTQPIPFDIDPLKLEALIENQPVFGQVHVERTAVNSGYDWSITFLSNVGDQPQLIVNPLRLLGSDPRVDVITSVEGVAPYMHMSKYVSASSRYHNTTFSGLATGKEWKFRVLAINSIGESSFSDEVSAIPAGVPKSVSSLVILPRSKSSLLARFYQDADSNGAAITSYRVSYNNGSVAHSVNVAPSNEVQRVYTYAHTLPFESDATFSLSLGSFYGVYNVYKGEPVDRSGSVRARVDVSHMSTKITLSDDSYNVGDLYNLVTPGEFIKVKDQEFRVCLNQDATFVKQYGELSTSTIPLCQVENPHVPAYFDAGFVGSVLYSVPLYALDTYLGGAKDPVVGSNALYVTTLDGNFIELLDNLEVGDWVAVGHPTEGEVFRVKSRESSMLALGPSRIHLLMRLYLC